jgi:hypothetical protein
VDGSRTGEKMPPTSTVKVSAWARAPAPNVFAGSRAKGSESGEEVGRRFCERRAGDVADGSKKAEAVIAEDPYAVAAAFIGHRFPSDAKLTWAGELAEKNLHSCSGRARTEKRIIGDHRRALSDETLTVSGPC